MGTGERRAAQGSSQSVHSSEEAGNDRGAKGRRKMERRRRHMSEQNLSAVTPAKEPKQDKEALQGKMEMGGTHSVDRSYAEDPGNRDQRRKLL